MIAAEPGAVASYEVPARFVAYASLDTRNVPVTDSRMVFEEIAPHAFVVRIGLAWPQALSIDGFFNSPATSISCAERDPYRVDIASRNCQILTISPQLAVR